ncbi:PREDICTED: ER degradation-enhancing alpha-mannosidase-like protein 3 [Amphimedon queenslandica]|uniref:alpha-1,2-Mannosidase n=1 Tax=Amphimedon queenslandica TaxID=400682 RepID=A0A1X7VC29_AMPQE|nr:PREDICTED: ER degradation-enhancing alpha-mannosidase-like protein 3 [Amphimedon queenslandica]|eukprot:XP_019849820.1 PREDICTED: ER degradation-enhancing alpha-mannosidase-like protein 3 [Amphimedon queenslandica]
MERIALPSLIVLVFLLCFSGQNVHSTFSPLASDNEKYKNLVVEMFFHVYDNYMKYAYPADELMPLSCKGRVRGREPSRGDVDDSLGRFSLTLIDSLDTLAVIGAIDEFSDGLKRVLKDVRFDANLTVSVFETNIRVLGGLLGAHFAADALKSKGHPLLQWYDGELVGMAKTVGDKLLPAFNTSTGIPYSRINLRYGMNDTEAGNTTCTACGGTILMEFAALSQLTGDPVYERKAHQAMEAIWNLRHSANHLVGTVVNVHNGQWTNKDSGVGAGIDSYYEYCLKSYILLGKKDYLTRFTKHYSAIKRYVSNGPFLLGVNMNSPAKPSKHFMDSLLAFWPGLQVLWGDIKSAVSIHNLLYDIVLHYKFLPEAFSPTDINYKVVWPQHPLRPEFIESTYFLYKATNDPFYLEVGKIVVDNLNKYARVACGFASIKDVKRNSKEDRLDSFFLAETLKYLYLLFSEDSDIPFNIDDFIFTTEAHLIPLNFSSSSLTKPLSSPPLSFPLKTEDSAPLFCPNVRIPWAESNYYYRLIMKQCPGSRHLYPLSMVLFPR